MRITTNTDARRAIAAAVADLTVIETGITRALRRLDDMTGGYPTSASGADSSSSGGGRTITAPDHPDDPVPATSVELAALNGGADRAAADLLDLLVAVGGSLVCAQAAANIATGRPGQPLSVAVSAPTAPAAARVAARWAQIAQIAYSATQRPVVNGRTSGLWDTLADLCRHTGRAARIVQRYTSPQLTARERAQLVEDRIYCSNPAHGMNLEPRRTGCHYCGWCLDVRRDYGQLPTPRLCDLHSSRRISDGEYRAAFGLAPGKGRAA